MCASHLLAQDTNKFHFAILGGLEINKESFNYKGVSLDRSASFPTRPTYPISIAISYQIYNSIYLKTGVDYSKKKIANDDNVFSENDGALRISDFKCFDIPLQVGFIIDSGEQDANGSNESKIQTRFEIGAYYSKLREAKYEVFDIETNKQVGKGEESYRFPVGFIAGVNWITGNFIAGFDLKYSLSKDDHVNSSLMGLQFKLGFVY